MSQAKVFQDAREGLRRYTEREARFEQQWRRKHDDAMKCFDFEGLLAFGLSLYKLINDLDEAWRVKVFRNLVPHDPAIDQLIDELYREWLTPFERLQRRLEELERDFEVTGAAAFRSACREVRGLLTKDADFFTHEKLIRLRDEAVEAHRQGLTEPFGGASD